MVASRSLRGSASAACSWRRCGRRSVDLAPTESVSAFGRSLAVERALERYTQQSITLRRDRVSRPSQPILLEVTA
jgi:hypothetical protein